ncbi:Hypothetical protein FKW44_007961 [Caligus rogercresseyi]|uniref:Uncharacterized protein n=1 Tax=Caligus rogercresseyi TaxID=217165 RepID=A0A7T8KFM0_CALRO|nr:Hypothetical protein FKW44_007961 [Caligus rogercresseyi]
MPVESDVPANHANNDRNLSSFEFEYLFPIYGLGMNSFDCLQELISRHLVLHLLKDACRRAFLV